MRRGPSKALAETGAGFLSVRLVPPGFNVSINIGDSLCSGLWRVIQYACSTQELIIRPGFRTQFIYCRIPEQNCGLVGRKRFKKSGCQLVPNINTAVFKALLESDVPPFCHN